MYKMWKIFLYTVPALVMIGFVPLMKNDYYLTLIYIVIIVVVLKLMKMTRADVAVLLFGFIGITFFEYIFVNTGIEIFTRNSLFGVMPLWLPLLWAYGFLAISRSVEILRGEF